MALLRLLYRVTTAVTTYEKPWCLHPCIFCLRYIGYEYDLLQLCALLWGSRLNSPLRKSMMLVRILASAYSCAPRDFLARTIDLRSGERESVSCFSMKTQRA